MWLINKQFTAALCQCLREWNMNHCVPSVAVTLGNDTVFDSWNKPRRDTYTNFLPEFKKKAINKLHACADIALALHHFDNWIWVIGYTGKHFCAWECFMENLKFPSHRPFHWTQMLEIFATTYPAPADCESRINQKVVSVYKNSDKWKKNPFVVRY